MLEVGTLLDNTYEIKQQIGAGGGGIIYRAYHTRLQKDVVVKLIKNDVKGKLEDRAEADILKNLKHTYLPQVFDFLNIDGNVYTVMDFIPGKSFSQELKAGEKYTQKQVIKWAGQLCEALEYLHKQKPPIIHSDIKPANVMLTPDDDVCLIDFNISLLFQDTNIVPLGRTNGYAPPEQYKESERQILNKQAQNATTEKSDNNKTNDNTVVDSKTDIGKTSINTDLGKTEVSGNVIPDISRSIKTKETIHVDERSDIYALGATLYHILTGEKPNTSIYGVKPLKDFELSVSDGLDFIISKAMASDPKRRFNSAEEMLKAIKNIHKLDRAYKRQIRKQEISAIIIIVLFALSSISAITGWRTLEQERSDKYYAISASAQKQIDISENEQALLSANTAMQMYPERIDAYYIKSLVLFKQGNYDEVIEYINNVINTNLAIQSYSDNILEANMYFIKANAYFEKEEYQQAIVSYSTAVHKNGKNSEYYRDYAISLARIGRIEEAEQILKTAVKKGLGSSSVMLVKGEISYSKKEYEEAEKSFIKVIEQARDEYLRERAYITCAQVYQKWEIPDAQQKQADLLEGALDNLSQDHTMVITEMLGEVYTRIGQNNRVQSEEYYQKAIDCFKKLQDRGYERFYIMHNIAILYQNIGQYQNAQTILLEMKEKHPENYKIYMQLAFLYADMQQNKANEDRNYMEAYKNYQLANKYYEKASKSNATDPQMIMLEDLMNEIRVGGWFA